MAAPVLQFKRGAFNNLPALKAGEPGFTTDKYDLYVGLDNNSANNKFFGSHRYWRKETTSTGSGVNLVEGSSTGDSYITLSSPDSLAGIVTYYFPGTQGVSNSVLTNDGNGNLTWGSGSANAVFTGITTFSDTTDNTLGDPDTGAVQIDGGVGINKNLTVGAGLSVVGTSRFAGDVTFASAAYFGDGDKLYFGDGNDLEIFHNGDNSFIKDTGTGTLNILASGFSVLNAGGNETLANFTPDGSVELYYDNSKKFETTGVGATITGDLGVSGNLYVGGQSEFIGVVTFRGGTINLGDGGGDDVVIGGEFASDLIPTTDDTYSLGSSSKQWKDLYLNGTADIDNLVVSGISTLSAGAYIDNIQIGISGNNVIDTTSGDLLLNSAGGKTIINDHVDIYGDLDVSGNISLGGTSITLRGTDVFIENKDIVLGYTTSITPNDTTANHAGVAIASTEGSPLVSFSASGINTLPDTYKQLMWFQNGTLGFGTDAFAFNYALAIGTTSMANGVRLAVGAGITMTDTEISASTFRGSLIGNVSSADQVKTVSAADNNANYYLTFVNSNNGSASNETIYTDDAIYYNPADNKLITGNALFQGDVVFNGTNTGTISTATRATLIDTLGTNDDATFYVTFVDTSNGQVSETLRTGTALSLNALSGNVKSSGDLIAGTGYLASGNGTRSMYMYDSSGDVAFQGKVIANNFRSGTNSNNTLTLDDIDASFARNLSVAGITTVTGEFVTGTNATIGGDITIGGNDIKASDGTTAITLTASTGNVGISSNLTVSGNLYVLGSSTEVNTETLKVEDSLIEVGLVNSGGSLVPPSSDLNIDVGLIFHYYNVSAKKSGIYWDDSASRVVISSDLSESNSIISSVEYADLEIGSLWVTDCAGTSQVISCSGSERFLENITVDGGSF